MDETALARCGDRPPAPDGKKAPPGEPRPRRARALLAAALCAPPPTRPLYAVDFSGAADYARRVWIASWLPGRPARVLCGADLPAFTYSLLVERIAGSEGVWLCDFPFGLPVALAAEQGLPTHDWAALVRAFAARYPTAETFYTATHARAGGVRPGGVSESELGGAAHGPEPKRRCDRLHRTPMAPSNRRLYKQTYHGLRDLLLPLLEHHRARVALLPWDAPVASARSVWVAEGCPASVLWQAGIQPRGYKGRTTACRERRAALLAALEASGLPIEAATRQRAVADPGGDALDALILLTAAARCADPARAAALVPGYPDHAARLQALEAAGLVIEADVYT
ncbi:MAG TPA: DUF429 domain-containing protein [Chloroflexota bacterium]|nr:DUF429 domain-containing protein [Chloroflexota bacterium]